MSAVADEKIKGLEEEVHDLKLLKGELMNSKNVMMQQRDTTHQHVYELVAELKELKSNYASSGEWCQLAKSACNAKECELADVDTSGVAPPFGVLLVDVGDDARPLE